MRRYDSRRLPAPRAREAGHHERGRPGSRRRGSRPPAKPACSTAARRADTHRGGSSGDLCSRGPRGGTLRSSPMKLNSREDLLLHGHEASLRSPRVLSEEAQRAVNLKRHAGERLEQAIMEVARQGYVLLRHGRLLKLLDRIVIW